MKQVEIAPAPPASTCRAWGAFFSPPIFVGTPLDMDDLTGQDPVLRALAKGLDTVYKGRQVVVSREGLVVVGEAQRATAAALLNEVMAVLIVRSVPVNLVREKDLLECSIDLANKEIDGEKWHRSGNHALPERRFVGWNARFYHPDNIRSFLRRAELLTSHHGVRKDLRLLLEAYTLHQESAFTPSFLLSWLGAARLLQAQWRCHAEQGRGDGCTEDAVPGVCRNARRVIEELHRRNALDPAAYREATRLWERQAALIESEQEATPGESDSCFRFFLTLLRRNLAAQEP